MNKNANSADVRCLTRTTSKVFKIILPFDKIFIYSLFLAPSTLSI